MQLMYFYAEGADRNMEPAETREMPTRRVLRCGPGDGIIRGADLSAYHPPFSEYNVYEGKSDIFEKGPPPLHRPPAR